MDLIWRKTYREGDEGTSNAGEGDPNWGVYDWACRAGQGAYLDWVVANSLLPSRDVADGVRRIDRTTVTELGEIAAAFNDIQAQMDEADIGLNPLGLGTESMAFDINPYELVDSQGQPSGRTHFEQIHDRALQALNNATSVFDYANRNTQYLRQQNDTLEGLVDSVDDREADFNSRLVEVYGYPYLDDIGPGRTYDDGYDGPDLYHYNYVDASELGNVVAGDRREGKTITFEVEVQEVSVTSDGDLNKSSRKIEVCLDTGGLGMVKPEGWTGQREALGEIQMARSDFLQAKARFEKTRLDYDNLIQQIEDQTELSGAQLNVDADEIQILNTSLDRQRSLNDSLKASRQRQLMYRTLSQKVVAIGSALSEATPSVMGVIAGLANGVIGDPFSSVRSAIRQAGVLAGEVLSTAADWESLSEMDHQQAKEYVQAESNIQITTLRSGLVEQQQFRQLEQLIRSEASMRLELYTAAAAADADWRLKLESLKVDDLWDIPEFRRYCKPFSSEDSTEPALVIRFGTEVANRLNFFGWPLGADAYYAPENFAETVCIGVSPARTGANPSRFRPPEQKRPHSAIPDCRRQTPERRPG